MAFSASVWRLVHRLHFFDASIFFYILEGGAGDMHDEVQEKHAVFDVDAQVTLERYV